MNIGPALLSEFEHEMAGARTCVERVPDDRLGWRPHPKSATMGRLAAHLAELAGFAERTLTTESFDMRPGGTALPALEAGSRAQILELFDRNVAAARAAIAATRDAEWMEPWTLLANGQLVFRLPRVAVVRNSVLNHSIHHRAQLTVYLRLTGVAVPALYGPSADE
jgi:uncharacterized damage-inducible protein DinB